MCSIPLYIFIAFQVPRVRSEACRQDPKLEESAQSLRSKEHSQQHQFLVQGGCCLFTNLEVRRRLISVSIIWVGVSVVCFVPDSRDHVPCTSKTHAKMKHTHAQWERCPWSSQMHNQITGVPAQCIEHSYEEAAKKQKTMKLTDDTQHVEKGAGCIGIIT